MTEKDWLLVFFFTQNLITRASPNTKPDPNPNLFLTLTLTRNIHIDINNWLILRYV